MPRDGVYPRGMQIGDHVPDFTATDQTGASMKLSDLLAGGPLVLFFYPKAFTPGCTQESCHFRDMYGEIKAAGGQAAGVSADSVEQQAKFAGTYAFPFPLLSDADHGIARLFGIKRPGFLPAKRSTFVIDESSTVQGIIASELHMDTHADEAIAILRKLHTAQ